MRRLGLVSAESGGRRQQRFGSATKLDRLYKTLQNFTSPQYRIVAILIVSHSRLSTYAAVRLEKLRGM
jgi:hypothetical protein